jgi:hypothetical protein
MIHTCTNCGTAHTGDFCDHQPEPEPADLATAPEHVLLGLLGDICEDRRVLDLDERLIVEALRSRGVSWPKIAHRLDINRMTLQRQYAYLQSDE